MKPRTISTLDGIFVLSESGFYEPYEPDPEVRAPGLIILGLCVIAWAAFIGAGYAVYQAFEALSAWNFN